MSPSELTALITTLAIVIADNVSDDNTLSLFAAVFTQLGDTLSTISTQRQLQESQNPTSKKFVSSTK